eukprot:m51a1_g13524 putative C-tail anchored protein, putative gpi16 subunit gpi transamidase component (477) ;mRNA; f:212-1880
MTQGRWDRDAWGYAPYGADAPSGAELWAWLPVAGANATAQWAAESPDQRWEGLRNAMAGLLCGSLGMMREDVTSSPATVVPRSSSSRVTQAVLRHGALPREAACTENLTPWSKLLPCKDRAGIAELLNPTKLYSGGYTSMALHARRVRSGDSSETWELSQTFSAVTFDHPALTSDKLSVVDLVGRSGVSACPLAAKSSVYIAVGSDQSAVSALALDPEPASILHVSSSSVLAVFDAPLPVSGYTPLVPVVGSPEKWVELASAAAPAVVAHMRQEAYGQYSGTLLFSAENRHVSRSASVTLHQVMPWWVRPFLSTIAARINEDPIDFSGRDPASTVSVALVPPTTPGVTPTTIEASAVVPPASRLEIEVSFEKVFVHWTKHPHDANRGWDMPSAIVVAEILGASSDAVSGEPSGVALPGWSPVLYPGTRPAEHARAVRIYTEGLLVSLPTPDFSMPYNVITLTCTAMSLFFGGVIRP